MLLLTSQKTYQKMCFWTLACLWPIVQLRKRREYNLVLLAEAPPILTIPLGAVSLAHLPGTQRGPFLERSHSWRCRQACLKYLLLLVIVVKADQLRWGLDGRPSCRLHPLAHPATCMRPASGGGHAPSARPIQNSAASCACTYKR